MSITNVKRTFLAKLLGQTNERKNLPEEGMFTPNPAAGTNPKLRFQNQSPLFGEGGIGAPAAPQEPAEVPASARSRYNLYEMTQPMPTRDTASEDIIKKRARVNAFGAGISGLAGLASMATGGDVAEPVDLITPWNMDQTKMLDQNYRGQMEQWVDRGFQVDQANTQLKNNEVDQTIDAENRMQQIDAQGKNTMAGIEARLAADMEKFNAKTYEDQAKELRDVGLDINSPNAYQEFMAIKSKMAKAQLSNIQARTNASNRIATGATGRGTGKVSVNGKEVDYSLPEQKRGKDLMLQDIANQKKALLESKGAKTGGILMPQDQAELNALNERYEAIEKYNPGSNEMFDYEIQQKYIQSIGGEVPGQQQQSGAAVPFDPNRGFTNVPIEKDPVVKMKADQNLTSLIPKLQSGDFSNVNEAIQSIMDLGYATTPEEAEEILADLLNPEEEEQ